MPAQMVRFNKPVSRSTKSPSPTAIATSAAAASKAFVAAGSSLSSSEWTAAGRKLNINRNKPGWSTANCTYCLARARQRSIARSPGVCSKMAPNSSYPSAATARNNSSLDRKWSYNAGAVTPSDRARPRNDNASWPTVSTSSNALETIRSRLRRAGLEVLIGNPAAVEASWHSAREMNLSYWVCSHVGCIEHDQIRRVGVAGVHVSHEVAVVFVGGPGGGHK